MWSKCIEQQTMKTFFLVAVSCSVALGQVVTAQDQDQAKLVKSRPKTSQPAPAQHVAPKIQRSVSPATVPSNANRWQRPPVQKPVNRPRAQANAAVRPSPNLEREGARTVTAPPQTMAPVQANANRRERSGNNSGNWNNGSGRNRFSYNYSWAEACRRHGRHHHHRDWWRRHYTRFALFGAGYYFWDGGYWFPAYGYDPVYNVYDYQEPIYGYDGLEPAQVIANVQTELQRLGYYPYAVDGEMGPMTRAAIANYQRDMGLSITSAIDQPTLVSLGLE